MKRHRSLLELYQWQADAFQARAKCMLKIEGTEEVAELANLIRALAQAGQLWEALEERKRIMLGKPLPGTLKPGSGRMKLARMIPETIIDASPVPPDAQVQEPSPDPDPGDFESDASPKPDATEPPSA